MVTDWKQELKNKILKEVKEQMAEMTRTILFEKRDDIKHNTNSPKSQCREHILTILTEMFLEPDL